MAIPAPPETDLLTPLVSRYLAVDEIIWGDKELNFVVRFTGQLRIDSSQSYDLLAEALQTHKLAPIFREEQGQHVILLVNKLPKPKASNPWVNLALFLFTLFSMLLVGAFYVYDGPPFSNEIELYKNLIADLPSGWPFAASLLGILLAHEFGHYLAARYHKTAVTLPYFLPFPLLGGFGTLGAFIQLKQPPKNKRILLDIGIAGPLAGLVVAIPIVLFGLYQSELSFIPSEGSLLEGNSILYLTAKYIVHGEWLPAPTSYGGVHPLIYWIRYLFTGLPAPFGAQDVLLGPIAWAGWAGLLVTALNLIPTGQLDGGHVMFVLLGEKTKRIRPIIITALLLLGLLYSGWWLWAGIIYFLGRRHAEPLDQITPLDPKRRALAIFTLIIFILVFVPVPIRIITGAAAGF
ncbi:MAG: site-2 protease family protein [Chloroflexi bacterium]|nr:site-2 protease family protein [Chloroflexota bacterium]